MTAYHTTSEPAVDVSNVVARGRVARGPARATLDNVTLRVGRRSSTPPLGSDFIGIIGAQKDGTALLFDVIDGSVAPRSGRVAVLGKPPHTERQRIARVSLDAPLPDALYVSEVCDLAGELRGDPPVSAHERLAVLGLGTLARRRVRSLSLEERRGVALAIALSSKVASVLLIEEPLVAIDPVAPRLVIDALRERSRSGACVLITTASPRDASRLADSLAVLTAGIYTPLEPGSLHVGYPDEAGAALRVVVSPSHGNVGAAKLLTALAAAEAAVRVETQPARSGSVFLLVSGANLTALVRAVTHAIATARVDVELIEPIALPLDAIRLAMAARAASPAGASPSPAASGGTSC
jgi:ABC-2 type transport system ATP-binding protein